MKKPEGYDDVQASGEFTPVELGGHHAIIKQVTERQSEKGKDMIVVVFDFAKNDKQPDYFMAAFEADTRDEPKWPYNGVKYVMVMDYEDPTKTSKQFKTFCNAVERSNDCDIKWGGNNWGQQFKGKKIGVVFGAEEHEWQGKISMRNVPKWFCRDDAVDDASIPAPKFLNGKTPATAQTSRPDDGFMAVPAGTEEEIPF